MVKKVLKILCMLILIICTLGISKSYASFYYDVINKIKISEPGVYGESTDIIGIKSGKFTHGQQKGYIERTIKDPTTGQDVNLSGRFWCADYGLKWDTGTTDWVSLKWNQTKDIPVGVNILPLLEEKKKSDVLAFILHQPESNSSEINDDGTPNNEGIQRLKYMQREIWKHVLDVNCNNHDYNIERSYCVKKKNNDGKSDYERYMEYLNYYDNNPEEYFFSRFETSNDYIEQIYGDYQYLGPFYIQTIKTDLDFRIGGRRTQI